MRLEARNLSVTLAGAPIIRNVSLDLAPGEVVGLIGPNGSGKSTLMRALARLVDAAGTVRVEGRDLTALSAMERARLVAHLPQTRIAGWSMAVNDLVALGRYPWGGRDAHGACEEAIRLMELEPLRDRPATELSGGEFARVLAARAIAQETPFLLADEPASGLDPAHQISMMMTLRRIAEIGRGVLVSLHDLALAARWCDRLLLMSGGTLAAQGVPDAVLTTARLRDIFNIEADISRTPRGITLSTIGLAKQGP